MNGDKKILILMICILSIYLLRLSMTSYNTELVDERNLYDFDQYQEMSKWFVGIDNQETKREYQYPPLYPILITPTLFTNNQLYLLIMDNIFITLTFIPLFLMLHRWLSFNYSIGISLFLVLFNIAFTPKNIGFPIALSTLLFTSFIYFLYDIDHKIKHCSLFFGILIATKYLFFFLSPMIFLWLYFRTEKPFGFDIKIWTRKYDLITKIGTLFAPAMIVFAIWSCRNVLLHGLSLSGMIGGYNSIFSTEKPLNIPVGQIPAKITSIYSEFLPNTMFNYFMIFIMGFIIMAYLHHKKNKIFVQLFDMKTYYFYILLLINLLLFFFTLGLTYDNNVFHWRYLSYLLPIYVALGLVPPIKILEYRRSMYKKKKQQQE